MEKKKKEELIHIRFRIIQMDLALLSGTYNALFHKYINYKQANSFC